MQVLVERGKRKFFLCKTFIKKQKWCSVQTFHSYVFSIKRSMVSLQKEDCFKLLNVLERF